MLCCTQGLQSVALWTLSNLCIPHMHTWKTSCSFNWDFSTNLIAKANWITSYLSKGHNSTHLQVSSALLLPWYTIQEISKCFSSESLIWASLTLTYGLYCYFKEKLLSNTWIFKHLFSFWIPLFQRGFISENYYQRLRNLKIFTNSYTKFKQVVKVMDFGVKGRRLQNICPWWSGLQEHQR